MGIKAMMIYHDRLISITENEIVFENYYFPGGQKKVVRLADIAHIAVKAPTFWNGKWRLQGTGNFKTWFPMDMGRPGRDRIFFASLKTQWVDIGFTAEDGEWVEKLLRERNLIRSK
jgi:hypothetical protein